MPVDVKADTTQLSEVMELEETEDKEFSFIKMSF